MSTERIAIANRLFAGPTAVCVEATYEYAWERDLDTLEGEHFDWVHDVIAIDYDSREGTVKLTTCRTIERPERPVYEFPRSVIEALYI